MSGASEPLEDVNVAAVSGFRLQSTHRVDDVLDGRYRIRGFMDSGGTAEVFLAEDLQERELVVIKQLTQELSHEPEVKRRFLHEATAAEAIDHPNVVRIKHVVEPLGEPPFLVMEALVGETLGEMLRRDVRLPVDKTLEIVREVGLALVATHEAGVVHRDVKPDNIFLLESAAGLRVKLIDFGMAKLKAVPCNGVVVGTAHYMAPEQILVEQVDGRTDVYGLGVVMFRMLTGHLPFDSEPRADMLRHQLFSAPPPASWLCDDLDPTVDGIVLKAMRKHPDNRYPGVSALLDDIAAVLDNQQQRASDPGLVVLPDNYVPTSEQGRAALALLARSFGKFAALSLADSA